MALANPVVKAEIPIDTKGPAPEAPYTKDRVLFHFRWVSDYSGGITCPKCMAKTQVTSPFSTDDGSNLTGIVSDIQGGEDLPPWERGDASDFDFEMGPDGQPFA